MHKTRGHGCSGWLHGGSQRVWSQESSVRAVVVPTSFWPGAAFSGIYEPVPLFAAWYGADTGLHTNTHTQLAVTCSSTYDKRASGIKCPHWFTKNKSELNVCVVYSHYATAKWKSLSVALHVSIRKYIQTPHHLHCTLSKQWKSLCKFPNSQLAGWRCL